MQLSSHSWKTKHQSAVELVCSSLPSAPQTNRITMGYSLWRSTSVQDRPSLTSVQYGASVWGGLWFSWLIETRNSSRLIVHTREKVKLTPWPTASYCSLQTWISAQPSNTSFVTTVAERCCWTLHFIGLMYLLIAPVDFSSVIFQCIFHTLLGIYLSVTKAGKENCTVTSSLN